MKKFYKDLGVSNLFGLLPEHYVEEVKARNGFYDAPDEFLTEEEKEMKKYIAHCKELQAKAAAKKEAEFVNEFFREFY